MAKYPMREMLLKINLMDYSNISIKVVKYEVKDYIKKIKWKVIGKVIMKVVT